MTAGEYHLGGSGTPLILLHGINSTWRVWQPVIARLEQQHTVLAPTLAGHLGGPPIAAGPHGIAPLADCVEHLMGEHGWRTAHLVGNSLGGWLACELAQRGRARSVVLFSPAGAWSTQRDFRRLARLMRTARNTAHLPVTRRLVSRPQTRRMLLRGALERGQLVPTPTALTMLDETRTCLLLEGLLGWMELHGDLRPFDIQCPVRLAWAEHDRTIPFGRYGTAFHRLVPDAELVTLPGVGHVPMFDDPALVARTILEHTSA